MSLNLDTPTLLRLLSHLETRSGDHDLSEVVGQAIDLWLTEQAKPAADRNGASERGYQWKSLFLPEGTVLRMWCYGDTNIARVEGDQIIHRGRSVSPNQFVQSFARSTRNAWMDLSIRRPGDKQFKLACRLRDDMNKAEQAEPAEPSRAPATPPVPVAAVAALIAALQAQAEATVAERIATAVAAPAPPRNCPPGPSWDLPERRKFRYRIEDVAFE